MMLRLSVTVLSATFCLAVLAEESEAADQTRPRDSDRLQELYREGQPPVLVPAPESSPEVVIEVEVPSLHVRQSFRESYQRAGAPRLAVFWNRTLSDGLRDMIADERIVINVSSSSAFGGEDKTVSQRETDRFEVQAESRRDDGARASPVTEIGEFQFQTGYLQPLIEEGASVIDRAAIMRITDAVHRLKDAAVPLDDRQLVETAALKDHADLLIQIALSPSIESETGVFFHVSVLEVQTGRIRATFLHDGTFPDPPEAPPSLVWKAVRGGYILVAEESETKEPKIGLEQMGRILSEKTMMALARL